MRVWHAERGGTTTRGPNHEPSGSSRLHYKGGIGLAKQYLHEQVDASPRRRVGAGSIARVRAIRGRRRFPVRNRHDDGVDGVGAACRAREGISTSEDPRPEGGGARIGRGHGGRRVDRDGWGICKFVLLVEPEQVPNSPGEHHVGVGLAAMAAGITGLAISTVRLKRAKQKRRYLEYQMEELERALP